MPTQQMMLECKYCGNPTQHIQNTPNHVLHLLLTVGTVGIWLLVWVLQSSGKPQCTVCGNAAPLPVSSKILKPFQILLAILLGAVIAITAAGVIFAIYGIIQK